MKNVVRKLFLFMVPIIVLASCDKKDHECNLLFNPQITAYPVTIYSKDSVHFEAEITVKGDYNIDGYGFVWGLWKNPHNVILDDQQVNFNEPPSSNIMSANVKFNFIPNQKYYLRVYIKSGFRYFYSNNETFTLVE